LIVNFGDFSRYVKNEKELIKGNISLMLNFVLISFFSILIVTGSDIVFAKNNISVDSLLTNPNDIIGKFNNTFLTIVVIFVMLIATSSTNLIANYVPAQNSLINFIPSKLSLKSSGIIIIIFSFFTGAFWLSLLSQIGILSLVDTLGSFFGPIFGLIIADYFIINKSKLSSKDLFNSNFKSLYYYSSGWHLKGIYSLILGFIFSVSTIWNTNLMFLQSYAWIIGVIITSLVYYLLAKD